MPSIPETVRALYPFESHFLDLPDGNRMHYVAEGEGEPLVFVHGNPTWSFLYRRFIAHYRESRRAVALDHIGFGLSTKPTTGDYYSIERHAENFGALMDHLDLRDITLVMQDWGGPICMGWAIDHRDRIKRLVVMDTLLGIKKTPFVLPAFIKIMRSRPLGELLFGQLNLFVRGLVERMLTKRTLTDAEKTAYRLPFESAAERAGVIAFPRLIPQKPGDKTWDLLARIEAALPELAVPTTLIWADGDPAFTPEYARLTHSLFNDAEGPHFVSANHYLQEDAPDQILELMDDFLHRHP